MLWSHRVRSVTDHSSEPKKGGLYGCSVRKSDFRATFGPKKKKNILCWPRCTAGLGAAAAGFSACNCLFDSRNCLLTSLKLGSYYKLNWPKRASAVYWLLGTLLYPCVERELLLQSPVVNALHASPERGKITTPENLLCWQQQFNDFLHRTCPPRAHGQTPPIRRPPRPYGRGHSLPRLQPRLPQPCRAHRAPSLWLVQGRNEDARPNGRRAQPVEGSLCAARLQAHLAYIYARS